MSSVKRWLTVLVAVVFVVGITGVALAGEAKIKGKVTAVDSEGGTITVTDKGGEEVVIQVSAEDLKKAEEGKKVRIVYHEEDGKNVADEVKWLKKKAVEGC